MSLQKFTYSATVLKNHCRHLSVCVYLVCVDLHVIADKFVSCCLLDRLLNVSRIKFLPGIHIVHSPLSTLKLSIFSHQAEPRHGVLSMVSLKKMHIADQIKCLLVNGKLYDAILLFYWFLLSPIVITDSLVTFCLIVLSILDSCISVHVNYDKVLLLQLE